MESSLENNPMDVPGQSLWRRLFGRGIHNERDLFAVMIINGETIVTADPIVQYCGDFHGIECYGIFCRVESEGGHIYNKRLDTKYGPEEKGLLIYGAVELTNEYVKDAEQFGIHVNVQAPSFFELEDIFPI